MSTTDTVPAPTQAGRGVRRGGGAARQGGRAMAKMTGHMEAGRYYEAQQMYKTMSFRYCNQKEYAQAIELLRTGAQSMLVKEQSLCGTELGKMIVEIYALDDTTVVSVETVSRIVSLCAFYPKGHESEVRKQRLLKSLLKWVTSSDKGKALTAEDNDTVMTEIHTAFAHSYASQGEYASASKHFLCSHDMAAYTSMLVQWSQKGYPSEADLFVGRAVLGLLAVGKLKHANEVYTAFLTSYTGVRTPLLNYLHFLLLTLERNALPLFQTLRQRYAPALARDGSFGELLDRIAKKFYNHTPQRQGGAAGGGMNNMFSMLSGMMRPQPRQQA
eukprot:TRINITY_DN11061_c0_g1_i1.p1 TRINITY_DN11061_c0_g1~~TRINITY_DN11061_c0_g1_i1.p1  ORF type:complete len:329 (+),score=50.80 TRINITY_DN11061_c0_g1_i1:69-1055(+)